MEHGLIRVDLESSNSQGYGNSYTRANDKQRKREDQEFKELKAKYAKLVTHKPKKLTSENRRN